MEKLILDTFSRWLLFAKRNHSDVRLEGVLISITEATFSRTQ